MDTFLRDLLFTAGGGVVGWLSHAYWYRRERIDAEADRRRAERDAAFAPLVELVTALVAAHRREVNEGRYCGTTMMQHRNQLLTLTENIRPHLAGDQVETLCRLVDRYAPAAGHWPEAYQQNGNPEALNRAEALMSCLRVMFRGF